MPKYDDFKLDIQNTAIKFDSDGDKKDTVLSNCSCDGRRTGCDAIVP